MKVKSLSIIFATLLSLANYAFAEIHSTSMKSNASIQATCSIRADDFSFGEIDQFNTQFITNNIFVKCNNAVSYTINGDDRAAKGLFLTNISGERLQYAVLTAPFNAWTTIFTTTSTINGISVGSNIQGVGTGNEKSHQIFLRVYGRDFGNVSLAAPGIYSDTFNISITY